MSTSGACHGNRAVGDIADGRGRLDDDLAVTVFCLRPFVDAHPDVDLLASSVLMIDDAGQPIGLTRSHSPSSIRRRA